MNNQDYPFYYETAKDMVNNDVEWLERHGIVNPDDLVDTSNTEESKNYVCGICGVSPIDTFPHAVKGHIEQNN